MGRRKKGLDFGGKEIGCFLGIYLKGWDKEDCPKKRKNVIVIVRSKFILAFSEFISSLSRSLATLN